MMPLIIWIESSRMLLLYQLYKYILYLFIYLYIFHILHIGHISRSDEAPTRKARELHPPSLQYLSCSTGVAVEWL